MILKVKTRSFKPDSPLERGNFRSSVTHRLPLERPNRRSSAEYTLPALLQNQVSARASNSPLERNTQTPARASKLPLERTTLQRKYWKGDFPARVPKAPLERTDQNLGNNTWFLSSTNLFHTCPTQPRTQKQGVNDVNEMYTTTNKKGNRDRYNLPPLKNFVSEIKHKFFKKTGFLHF